MSFQMHELTAPRMTEERRYANTEYAEIMRMVAEAENHARIERREHKRLQREIARRERGTHRRRITRFLHATAKRA